MDANFGGTIPNDSHPTGFNNVNSLSFKHEQRVGRLVQISPQYIQNSTGLY
jgi:hypothetical protein